MIHYGPYAKPNVPEPSDIGKETGSHQGHTMSDTTGKANDLHNQARYKGDAKLPAAKKKSVWM